MPIDILSGAKRVANRAAHHSVIGGLIGNPFWAALLTVAIIVAIMYILDGWNSDGPTFKLIFYLVLSVGGMLLIHDSILEAQIKEKFETNGGAKLIEQLGQMEEILEPDEELVPVPRQADAVRRNFNTTTLTADELLEQIDSDM